MDLSGVGRSTTRTNSISDTPANSAGGFGHPELAAPGRHCAVATASKFAELPRKFGGRATCSNCCVSLQSLKPGPRIYAFDNYTGLALMLINITGFKLYHLLSSWRGCYFVSFLSRTSFLLADQKFHPTASNHNYPHCCPYPRQLVLTILFYSKQTFLIANNLTFKQG